jgi:hypothetical protein
MEFDTLALAIIPPSLAMLVEFFNPISDNVIQTSTERDLKGFLQDPNYQVLVETVTKATTAAVEVSGLAPTFVASVTSGFAVIHELSSPFWPATVYVLLLIAVALYLFAMLGGRSFFQIDDTRPIIRIGGRDRSLPWTRTKMVSIMVYLVNTSLIVLSVIIYLAISHHPLEIQWPYS